jgi:hypothetical protein
MGTLNVERKMHWLRLEPGGTEHVDDYFENLVEKAEEDTWVLIGQWYYYLHVYQSQIDLCRTQAKLGEPLLTEVMKPGYLAISDDDLECAVQYGSFGTFEPGHYRISPLIERKLRILFE